MLKKSEDTGGAFSALYDSKTGKTPDSERYEVCMSSETKAGEREIPRGIAVIHDPRINKGTAFTSAERKLLGISGLLPPKVMTQEEQAVRIMEAFHTKSSDLSKYIYLTGLHDRNEALYYYVLMHHVEEMLPIVYTPTVGEGCKQFGHIYRRPRGLYVTYEDRGNIEAVLRNWPNRDIEVIVVTDGERILGLGDLGANGMGIPIGKLSLYTALAGIDPALCLPITLDVGTNNQEFLDDPLYIGKPHERIQGDDYDDFVEEFVMAVQKVFPSAILQFEDFAFHNAIRLLAKYRDRVTMFNDDIQGTAAVTLAGLLSASRLTGQDLTKQQILFFGAGAAATGIGQLIVERMVEMGMDRDEAMGRIWFRDSKGLVVKSRDDLAEHKIPFAHDHPPLEDLKDIITRVEPTALIGVSGQGQTFTEPVICEMGRLNDRPIILALSNPTSKSECTAEQAYSWTKGRAVFASGSPFNPVEVEGRKIVPGQGNNAYIFPGVGLGVMASRATRVTDRMFIVAATTLAGFVSQDSLDSGCIYPPIVSIRDVSAAIAVAVAEEAWASGVADGEPRRELLSFVKALMYQPEYPIYA